MRFPLSMTAGMAQYIFRNKMRPKPEWQKSAAPRPDASNPFRVLPMHVAEGGRREPHPMINKRFPLVLMLEPLHACNLTCTGCGRIREYEATITQRLPLEECLAAVDECGAPMVSICGGEPMMYPQIGELVAGILERNRNIYLCTNGMFIVKRLHEFRPDRRFFFNVHLDGLEKTHDICVEKEGVFREAIEGIQAAKRAGFMVCTNTTIYKETDMKEIEALFEYLQQFDVDGHQLSPAYGYSAVNDREIFMTRDDIHEKFRDVDTLFKRFRLNQTPMYLDFLKGDRDLPCTAWGNPTYNIKGWKGPCYLITDAHYRTFEALMTETPWENYGHGNDPRCEHCMVHCGYEPSAALGINSKLADSFKMLTWALR
ncbi:MAG TPA: adenosyl-hopene transferase HpnH [Bryobacteraceae bacterium]|nr:adenosyl-hopene transferase HpnH [Bryobacteraceae bacterium]